MKLQFKHQKFQADAAKAVVDVFAGQPYLTTNYRIDNGSGIYQTDMETSFTGWRNEQIVPELSDSIILEHLQKIQRTNQIEPSKQLEGHYNLTIEMETGVGKTYTYIKTMYELNKHYGWSKFIVVVPSVAIREGVYKSFEVTQDHFAEEYGKKIRFFIYNSAQLTEIDRFASDSSINVMIINSQAFNAKGKDARRIYMKLDEFRSRRPIDIIAKTNPILIIDEPQSVEGKQTKERMKEFNPMIPCATRLPTVQTASTTWSTGWMQWKPIISVWLRKSWSKALRNPAVPLRMGLSIWKASIFPRQTLRQRFSSTARENPACAR